MILKILSIPVYSGLLSLGSAVAALSESAPEDEFQEFLNCGIGVNVTALQNALKAVQKSPQYRVDDQYHFLKSAVFYTHSEFLAAKKEYFDYALENSPNVKTALEEGEKEKRDGILVLTFNLKGEGRTDRLVLGGSLVYFCHPVTGEVLFFRGGK